MKLAMRFQFIKLLSVEGVQLDITIP